MNYEERYNKALERAKKELKTCGSLDCDAAKQLFRVFPELKESEDQKIREAAKHGLQQLGWEHVNGIKIKDILAWLEKQECWTLEDAKDGDVLVSFYGKPFIYNGRFIASSVGAYCGLNIFDNFVKEEITKASNWTRKDGVKPATKEQRDTLFAKMKEVGYEWDAENKELKKIEQESAWSEEDEYQINTILHGLDLKREIYKKQGNEVEERRYNAQYNWLKSLKDRVGCEVNCTTTKEWKPSDEEQKFAWSDADEERFVSCLQKLGTGNIEQPDTINTMWLKSIKTRVQSIAKFVGEEQYMKGVRDGVNDIIKHPEDYGLLPSPF